MSIGEAIGIVGGSCGLIATLWKVFNVIGNLQRQIEELENENEKSILTTNGMRERVEHTHRRTVESTKTLYDRINRVEAWLTKHTEYEPLKR
jgi:regulator of replication initiation timing